MKQKDYGLIIVIMIISAVVSFVISAKIFVTPSNRQQKVPTVGAINSEFDVPNPKYFNSTSLDFAQQVNIGSSANKDPFKSTNQ